MKNPKQCKQVIDQWKYEPVTYDECKKMNELLRKKLTETGYDRSRLYSNCDRIIEYTKKILEHAEKSVCGQIRANGYFSFARLAYCIMESMDSKLLDNMKPNKLAKRIESFDMISDLIVQLAELIIQILEKTNLENEQAIGELEDELTFEYPEFYRNQKAFRQITVNRLEETKVGPMTNGSIFSDSNNIRASTNDNQQASSFESLPLLTPHLETIRCSIFEGIKQPNTKNKDIIYRELFLCWIDPKLAKFFKSYAFMLPFLRAHFFNYPRLLFDRKYRSKFLNKVINYPTINFPVDFLNLQDTKAMLFAMRYFTRNTNAKSKVVRIPTQNSIEITRSPVDRLILNHKDRIVFDKQNSIRCKLTGPKHVNLENYDKSWGNKLGLHFHGGGFFCTHADSHEIYLKHWVKNSGIPILSVDYRLKRAFPAGLQDCLDVYLWLRQAPEEEVKSKLGFYPKQIVLIGDSAGGNFAMGIILILNDLRTSPDFSVSIKMPTGSMLIYAALLVHLSLCPSASLSSLDTLIPIGMQIMILYGISGHIDNLKPNHFSQVIKSFLFPSTDPKPFFDCPDEEFKEKLTSLAKEIDSPYFATLFYDKFDQITDCPIHLISAEFCPLLDESITLAKILGNESVKVDVIKGMCHGFLNAHFISPNVHQAMIFVGQKITDMFD